MSKANRHLPEIHIPHQNHTASTYILYFDGSEQSKKGGAGCCLFEDGKLLWTQVQKKNKQKQTNKQTKKTEKREGGFGSLFFLSFFFILFLYVMCIVKLFRWVCHF